jgi:hypothetical protein
MHLGTFFADKVGEKVGHYIENSRFTVVASGQNGSMRWVAVPYSQAAAFRHSYPKAAPADVFFNVLRQWQRSNPDGYRAMQGFAQDVIEAGETYGSGCQILVLFMGG